MIGNLSSFTLAALLGSVASAVDPSMFEIITDASLNKSEEQPKPLKSNLTTSGFGSTVFEQVYPNNYTEKVISQPDLPFFLDYDSQALAMQNAADWHAEYLSSNGDSPVYNCANRTDPFGSPTTAMAFLPDFDGYLSEESPKITVEGRCFEQIEMTFAFKSDTTFEVDVTRRQQKHLLCTEAILFANTEIQHFELFAFPGTSKFTFEMKTTEAQTDTHFAGIKAFGFCDGVKESIESIWNFAKAFVGGISDHPYIPYIGTHVPHYMEEANVEFLAQSMGYQLEKRETKKVEIDPDLIGSGDFISIMRLDGLDPIIMYGTGSHAGHSTMALRFDGELYIVESQDAWYWPTHGL